MFAIYAGLPEFLVFLFNDPANTDIYPLSLHDALPISRKALDAAGLAYKYLEYGSYLGGYRRRLPLKMWTGWSTFPDRKSTRLNSSHVAISYAVFCLKKKK